MKSRLEKVWPPPPPLQLRKLIAKLYGPSPSFLAHFCLFSSSGAFFLSFDGESLCDSPPHSRSAASEGRDDDAVDSADTQKGRFKPFLWKCMPEQPLALFLPLFVSLANWGQFLLSLLRLFQLPSPLSASRPSRKLLTERRGRDRLGDREIPSDIMPAVFHGR